MKRTGEFGCCGLFVVLWALFLADRLLLSEDLSAITFLGYGWIGAACLAWTLLLMAPVLAFGRKVRFLYAVLLPPWALLVAFQWYLHVKYHFLLWGDWVGIALCSSVSEVAAFLRDALTPLAVLGTLGAMTLAGLLAVWCGRGNACGASGGKSGFRLAAACVLVFFGWCAARGSGLTASLSEPMAVGFVTSTVQSAKTFIRLQALKESPRVPKGLKLAVPSASAPVCVFVLGESATRNRWGLYGYARDTTPRLSALGPSLCVFSNATASASQTGAAMQRLFLRTDPTTGLPDCSLAQVLSSAGYDCVLLSNHDRWGRFDGFEDFLFSSCRELRHLSEEKLPRPWYDDALLPYLDRALASAGERPTVVFLHLMGSHMSMDNRYPAEQGRFPAAKLTHQYERNDPAIARDHYDNSIAFTDAVLGEVVARLKKTGRPAWMLYVSDHGESVDSSSWRDRRDPSLWEVPMVWWRSASYEALAPDVVRAQCALSGAPLRSESIFEMILQMALVKELERK